MATTTATDRSNSRSPQRRSSITQQIASFGAKLGILHDVDGHSEKLRTVDEFDTASEKTKVGEEGEWEQDNSPARSVSRGRDSLQSSGRGGAGNIRRSSKGPSSPVPTGGRDPDLYSPSPVRGREPGVDRDKDGQTHAVGRGGIGNIRSRSRARATSQAPEGHPQTASIISEAAANMAEYERNVIKAAKEAADAAGVHKSGRGGAGNIQGSRSRSRGPVHSSGRGGIGNIQTGAGINAEDAEALDEVDRLRFSTDGGVHSTGRGGRANLTRMQSPPPEHHAHFNSEYDSVGRGGAGNIQSRSVSRDPNGRSTSRDPNGRSRSKDPNGFAKIWNKVARTHSRDVEEQPRGRSAIPQNVLAAEALASQE